VEGEGIQRTHRSTFTRAEGTQGQMFEYLFGYQADDRRSSTPGRDG